MESQNVTTIIIPASLGLAEEIVSVLMKEFKRIEAIEKNIETNKQPLSQETLEVRITPIYFTYEMIKIFYRGSEVTGSI